MKIQLPLETWCELLGFLPRPYLGQIVLHIRNRQLAAIIHFYLHKYGEVKLGHLETDYHFENHFGYGYRGSVAVRKWVAGNQGPPVPIDADPAYGIPENVKDFEALVLSYFDESMVPAWLQKFARHHLLTNVNLHLPNRDRIGILYTLLPLMESIESVRIQDHLVLAKIYAIDAEQQKADNPLATGWLARTRILQFCFGPFPRMDAVHEHIDRLCRWLYTPAPHPNGPRILLLSFAGGNSYAKHLLKRFEEDFINADECVSYFVRLRFCVSKIDSKSLKNARTKEKFSIKVANYVELLITRLPGQASPGWIEQKEKEVREWDFFKQSRRIHLTEPLNY